MIIYNIYNLLGQIIAKSKRLDSIVYGYFVLLNCTPKTREMRMLIECTKNQ